MKTILKSTTILFLFWILSANRLQAQDLASMKDAFTNSYIYEYNKEYSKAIAEILKVYNASSYETNLRLGWLYYENGAYTNSVQYYEKAVALMPKSIEALSGYILPQSALSNKEKVLNSYKEIIKIEPNNSVANYNLGVIYYFNKDYKTACEYLEKASGLYPFDYYINIYLAWTYLKLARKSEAKTLFNRVLLIVPTDTSAKEGLLQIK